MPKIECRVVFSKGIARRARTHTHTREACISSPPCVFFGMRRSFSLFSVSVKRTTGVVGLPVEPRAREVLVALYEKTLKDIQVSLLESAHVVCTAQCARLCL
jgi:hypothetical protein